MREEKWVLRIRGGWIKLRIVRISGVKTQETKERAVLLSLSVQSP
jgi:hypothetical protein